MGQRGKTCERWREPSDPSVWRLKDIPAETQIERIRRLATEELQAAKDREGNGKVKIGLGRFVGYLVHAAFGGGAPLPGRYRFKEEPILLDDNGDIFMPSFRAASGGPFSRRDYSENEWRASAEHTCRYQENLAGALLESAADLIAQILGGPGKMREPNSYKGPTYLVRAESGGAMNVRVQEMGEAGVWATPLAAASERVPGVGDEAARTRAGLICRSGPWLIDIHLIGPARQTLRSEPLEALARAMVNQLEAARVI